MRFAGRIDPGSGAGVFTGQRVLFLPARMALTRAMLSFFVLPLTDGTVIGGSFGAESLATAAVVLEAVVPTEDPPELTGVDVAEDNTF